MPVTEMIIGVSAGLFMLIGFLFFLRLIQAWLLHRTLRDAIARDSALAGGLIERIDGPADTAEQLGGDDRNGLVLIAIGIALLGFGLIAGEADWQRYVTGAALFPLLVGIALLARHVWLRRRLEREFAARS